MTEHVFIGLVTHKASRFADATGPDGLMARIGDGLRAHGLDVTTFVSDEDEYAPELARLDEHAIKASIDCELATEERWRAYLDPRLTRGLGRLGLAAFMRTRRMYRRSRYRHGDDGARMVRRLVNIELSHLRVMRAGVASGADWVLIVEDDAAATDVDAYANALASFIERRSSSSQPAYVNVSRSFTDTRLRTSALLEDAEPWDEHARLLAAKRPITNTVCAILYRGAFLARLLVEMESIPLEPVQPIDWKLNDALMRMTARGMLGAGDCWSVAPAPLVQRSMH